MSFSKPLGGLEGAMGRIPFGLNPATGEYVDVSDVPRGSASGCVCPSCRVPLQAKQGEVNRWHFAHESRGTYKLAADHCDFSIWTAMVLMARQELSRADHFQTPDYLLTERVETDSGWQELSEVVTTGTLLSCSDPRIETCFAGVTWDAILTVQGFSLCLVLTHRQKHFSLLEVNDGGNVRHGVVSIDLVEVWDDTLRRVDDNAMSHRDAFRRSLLEGLVGKQWEHHPRAQRTRAGLRARIAALPKPRTISMREAIATMTRHISPSSGSFKSPPKRRNVRCFRCNTTWRDPKASSEACPGCGVEGTWIDTDWTP